MAYWFCNLTVLQEHLICCISPLRSSVALILVYHYLHYKSPCPKPKLMYALLENKTWLQSRRLKSLG